MRRSSAFPALLACSAMVLATCSLARAADGEKQGELPARSGAVFEREGLRFQLAMPRSQVSVGKPLAFQIAVENVSKVDRTLLDSHTLDADFWTIQVSDAQGQVWRVIAPPRSAGPPSVSVVLKAGEKRTISFTATEHYRFQPLNPRGELVEHLPAGRYEMSVRHTFRATKNNAGVWQGEVVLEKIGFAVLGAVR